MVSTLVQPAYWGQNLQKNNPGCASVVGSSAARDIMDIPMLINFDKPAPTIGATTTINKNKVQLCDKSIRGANTTGEKCQVDCQM